jgi:hypothetical protein
MRFRSSSEVPHLFATKNPLYGKVLSCNPFGFQLYGKVLAVTPFCSVRTYWVAIR